MNLPLIDVSFTADSMAAEQDWSSLVERAVGKAISVAEIEIVPDSELSVLLCDDKTIQELNARWRDKNKPTNVLSFPTDPQTLLLGDIAISLETVRREAMLENKSLRDHFTHLVIHGFLHLFGYDHETDSDAVTMEQLETEILAALGIADPYNSE